MTALVLLLHVDDSSILRHGMLLIGGLAILFVRLRTSRLFWAFVAIVLVMGNVPVWYVIDNHKYLTVYWCLAVLLALCAKAPRPMLAYNARILIGLCFLLATLWKLFSPEFMDARFFHWAIIADIRFEGMADIVCGLDRSAAVANREAHRAIAFPDVSSVALNETPRVLPLARFMVVWTLLVEALIALMFLWPRDDAVRQWRDVPLLVFIVTTYPIATVQGFASLLVVMAVAQGERNQRVTRLVYILIFAALPLLSLPYVRVFNAALDLLAR